MTSDPRVHRRPKNQITLGNRSAQAFGFNWSDPMLENVSQAAAACPNQIRSEWSNKIARAEDRLKRVVQREAGNGSELLELMNVKATLGWPQMLQANQSAWLDI